ncbi:predicted protein [Histoplasma mississippiense (nom. inval.)]|uniref:predicted protein n=1 Tax=Ajellomyces capsulatus (strain NAm1 / WU24) TaxID=2059318 RepID=UPI000157C8A8|nr:predicted protein [Histoplasma mississippiense (nom. inval.)]EDN08964.1 predicted protein [Histoplasma mississippiense (nom. inval.)]
MSTKSCASMDDQLTPPGSRSCGMSGRCISVFATDVPPLTWFLAAVHGPSKDRAGKGRTGQAAAQCPSLTFKSWKES